MIRRRKPPESSASSERQETDSTIRPPFDPAEFARGTESRIRLTEGERARTLQSTVPPPPGLPRYPRELAEPAPAPLTGQSVVSLAVDRAELDWFELPALALRLVPHINGNDSIARICEISGTELADALSLVEDLVREGFVSAESDTRA